MRNDLPQEASWLRTEGQREAYPLRRSWRGRRAELALFAIPAAVLLSGIERTGAAASWLAAFLWPLALAFRAARRQDEAAMAYDALRDAFPMIQGELVRILVRQGDAPTGEDVGVLWVEEGRLYFAGRRTSFGLLPSDVRGACRFLAPARGVRHELEITLRRRTAVGPMALSFAPVLLPREKGLKAQAALEKRVNAWIDSQSEGEGQLPPAALGPGIVGERRLLAEAAAMTLVGTLFCGWVGSSFFPDRIVAPILFGLVLFMGAIPASNLRWRALRDRRRLRRVQS